MDGEDVPVGTGTIDGTGYSIGSSGGSSSYVFEDGAVTCDCSASSEPRPEVIADEVRASCWFCSSWPSIFVAPPISAPVKPLDNIRSPHALEGLNTMIVK